MLMHPRFILPAVVFLIAAVSTFTAMSIPPIKSKSTTPTTTTTVVQPHHWLALPIDQLSDILGGSGKAKLLWETVRAGVDPLGPESPLSLKAQRFLGEKFSKLPTVVSGETVSSCGGRKQLHLLHDGLEVESVIIPHANLPRTTLCISNQVGCDRGCIFCATGKMGLVRNLSAGEILSQVFWAKQTVAEHKLQEMKNIVFMGMGDIGMNLEAVTAAVESLVDHDRFAVAPSKITLSTVGPNPDTFKRLCAIKGVNLAWSLHSAVPALRKELVRSSFYHDPVDLRDALLEALLLRSPKQRSIMIAVTMMRGINSAPSDASELASFLEPFKLQGVRVNVDLIPYNDIGMAGLQRPTDGEIVAFKQVLWEAGINHSVRLTRGEDEAAACGMLATSRYARQQAAPASNSRQ